MSYNDQWQRDQRDRELGMMGFATGSAANREALNYRDTQQRITQQIMDDLNKQYQPKISYPSRANSTIYPVIGGGANSSPRQPMSSTSIFLSLSVLVGLLTYLVTGSSVSTGIAASMTAGAFFGLRALCRTRPARQLGAFLARIGFAAYVIGLLVIKASLILSIPTLLVYFVWQEAGQSAALWTAGGFAVFAAFLVGMSLLNAKYQRYRATPAGKIFVRRLGMVRFVATLGAIGVGIWWLLGAA